VILVIVVVVRVVVCRALPWLLVGIFWRGSFSRFCWDVLAPRFEREMA